MDPCIVATLRKLQDGYFAGARFDFFPLKPFKNPFKHRARSLRGLFWCRTLRVQMSDLSSVQTTSFHTRLTFLDEDSDDLFEDVEEEDEELRASDLPEGP